ncbi:MAG: Zn-dependent alcohol dehydrogenase, partial [Chloroflexi bacterium]|nr:Zn-dependent alcohol dehydrogenase [Chloroflexota bacterium]
VLVRMVATGICHSDLHIMKGDQPNPMPVVLGHEGAGVVVKVGPAVTKLKPGDHVVLPAIYSCGECRHCIEGRPTLCSASLKYLMMGTMPSGEKRLHMRGKDLNHFFCASAFAEYAVVPDRIAVRIRPDAPLDVACVVSCAVSTGAGAVINQSGLKAGESIVIYGCGGIGLSAVMGAKLAGAGKLIAVDIVDRKLEKARELGANHTINASRQDPLLRVMEITGEGADCSIESIGNVKVMAQAFGSIRMGGTCVIVGAAPFGDLVCVAPYELLWGKKLTGSVLGNVRAEIDVPRYVDLYMDGLLPVNKLVSRYYKLDEINEAFADLERGEVIRGVIRF